MLHRVAFFLGLLAFVQLATWSRAADWQWSVPVESMVSGETNDHPRAFLWIPPHCQRVRAVVLGQHNMEEEPILEHPQFRAMLSELGFAAIWISPSIDLGFNTEAGVGVHFEATLAALALESGYSELATAPVVPIGHSASASFPWNFALWNPARTLAVLSVSGAFPAYQETEPPLAVPGLVTLGDYEGALNRSADGLKQRNLHPHLPLSMVAEMGGGHFDASDRKVTYLALYLKKVAQYRLGPDGALLPIDPLRQGWLVDRWRGNEPPTALAAPVAAYTGDGREAFWCFDEEHARATEAFLAFQRGKKADLLGYVQDGKVVGQNPKLHAQVALRFVPQADGISFTLTGTYLDTVPEGRPEWWTGLPKGSPVTHDTEPITITRICGPVVQTGPDTWALRFYRMGMTNTKRTNDIWFFASHPGGGEYKRAVQQASLRVPMRNTQGPDQHLTFPEIAAVPAGTATLKLNATSDAGVPVYYYLREGPGEIAGDTLVFTELPPRSRLPIKVTVVAWQYGRGIEPKLKTAEPVERTFFYGAGPARDTAADQAARAAIWAKATAAIRALEEAKAAAAQRAIAAAEAAPNTISINFCKALGMRPTDLAGADARVGNWNNIKDLKRDTAVTLTTVLDKSGHQVPDATITVTGGASPVNSFDGSTDELATAHDTRLFNGLYDGDQGAPTVIEVTHIPYARYDVYVYRADDGDQRASTFKIGAAEQVIRGGRGTPTAAGKGYVAGGNYALFSGMSGANLQVSCTASPAGDPVQRNKLVGLQIVERK